MTQKDDLIKALLEYPNMTATNIELTDDLGFPSPSIRRLTGTLTNKGILERVDRGTYQLVSIYRHFISAAFYCGGKRKIYFARTFSPNSKDLFRELLDELNNHTQDMCSNAKTDDGEEANTRQDYNYESALVEVDDVDQNYIYPEIEVDEE